MDKTEKQVAEAFLHRAESLVRHGGVLVRVVEQHTGRAAYLESPLAPETLTRLFGVFRERYAHPEKAATLKELGAFNVGDLLFDDEIPPRIMDKLNDLTTAYAAVGSPRDTTLFPRSP